MLDIGATRYEDSVPVTVSSAGNSIDGTSVSFGTSPVEETVAVPNAHNDALDVLTVSAQTTAEHSKAGLTETRQLGDAALRSV